MVGFFERLNFCLTLTSVAGLLEFPDQISIPQPKGSFDATYPALPSQMRNKHNSTTTQRNPETSPRQKRISPDDLRLHPKKPHQTQRNLHRYDRKSSAKVTGTQFREINIHETLCSVGDRNLHSISIARESICVRAIPKKRWRLAVCGEEVDVILPFLDPRHWCLCEQHYCGSKKGRMEVAGIEPASEKRQEKASTRLVFCISHPEVPRKLKASKPAYVFSAGTYRHRAGTAHCIRLKQPWASHLRRSSCC